MNEPIRIAIIGTAKRSAYLYGPLLKALPGGGAGLGVGPQRRAAQKLGESLGVPWYTDLDKLVRETAPQIGIVSVSYGANGEVGLMAVEAGLNVLLETPIAHKLSEADAIIAAADAARAEDRGRRAVPPPPAGADQAEADRLGSVRRGPLLLQRLRRARLPRRQRACAATWASTPGRCR